MTSSSAVGQKLWNYCNILRDAGLSYGDYLEQLTYLIFLKMMDERSRPLYTLLPDYQPPPIPQGYGWPSLMARDGDELETHYRHILETLARRPGTLGVIFRKAQNKIQEPAMLTRLVRELINSENWLSLSADVKGDAYESLLECNAQDVKTGAGQYFTPRPAGHYGELGINPTVQHNGASWTWNGDFEMPTLKPSVNDPPDGWHGWLTDGAWHQPRRATLKVDPSRMNRTTGSPSAGLVGQ